VAKKQTFVGIEQDAVSVRGVRLSLEPGKSKNAKSSWKLLSAEEISGNDLLQDSKSVDALKKLKSKLGVQSSDKVTICLGGKQTYAAQMDVRKLPDHEMMGMLKLELRKSMPFEASISIFDYQFLPVEADRPKEAGVPVIVSAATSSHLSKQVSNYDKAGLPPYHVDVLPISVANAFWATRSRKEAEASTDAYVILHMGSDVCTLVIDGGKTPFFNRTFSFSMTDVINNAKKQEAEGLAADILLSMNVLISEITKSINYYKNTNSGSSIASVAVMGAHASNPAFAALGKRIGYEVETVQTASLVHTIKPTEPGKYDLAIALAMQAA